MTSGSGNNKLLKLQLMWDVVCIDVLAWNRNLLWLAQS
uniref:Uncharacterized protein n=1 Tax=Arundo donax TaxID=35708 RepID=A0A0A8YZY4_ARUDO